jgi:hypothetical protein
VGTVSVVPSAGYVTRRKVVLLLRCSKGVAVFSTGARHKNTGGI